MFKLLGIALALYTAHAAMAGRVYIKSGPGGRAVERQHERGYFWVCIAIYAALSVALLTLF